MKKTMLFFVLVLVVAFSVITGCKKTDNTTPTASCSVQISSFIGGCTISSGCPGYSSIHLINSSAQDITDATVIVNGITLPWDGYAYASGDGGFSPGPIVTISAGDTVTISINSPTAGNFSASGTMPTAGNSYLISPSDIQGCSICCSYNGILLTN